MTKLIWSAVTFAVFTALSACSPQSAATVANRPWPERIDQVAGWANERAGVPPPKTITLGTLENGLRYYIEPNHAPGIAVSIRLTIDAGAMHDPSGKFGTAHLVSHILAKDAMRDGLPHLQVHPRQSIVPLATVFGYDLPDASPEKLGAAFDQLAALATTQVPGDGLPGAEAEILQEMKENGDRFALSALAPGASVFGSHPIMRWTLDAARSDTIDLAAVRDFHTQYYVPGRAHLVIVGNIDPLALQTEIRKRFGEWKASTAPRLDPAPLDEMPSGPELVVNTDSSAAPTLSLALMNTVPFRDSYQQKDDLRTQFVEETAMAALCSRICTFEPGSASSPFAFLVGPVRSMLPAVRQGFVLSGTATDSNVEEIARAMVATWRDAAAGVTQPELDAAVAKMRQQAEQDSLKIRVAVRTDLRATEMSAKVLDDPLFLAPDARLRLIEAFAPTLLIDEVNRVLADLLSHRPRMIVTGKVSSEQALRDAVSKAWKVTH